MANSLSQASETSGAGASKLPAYTESARLRLATGTLLYLAQGLIQGLFMIGMPTWLAANGQSAGAVGAFIAAIGIPWSLKFLTGLFVDRYAYLAMGRRRGWLVGAQMVILIFLFAIALVNPTAEMLFVITPIFLVLSFLTSLQDVALDAMIVDLTPPSELGTVNAFMLAGKSVGLAGGGAVTAYFIEFHGFQLAMLVVALMFLIPAVMTISIRERPGEKLFPWTKGEATPVSIEQTHKSWWAVFRETLAVLLKRDPLLIAALCIFYGIHQGILEATLPVFATQEMGWGETRYASMVGVGYLVTAGIGLLIGGWLSDKVGPSIIAQLSAGFASLLIVVLILFQPGPEDGLIFTMWYLTVGVIIFFFYLCMVTLGMRVCKARVAATSYALLMASMAVGMTMGAAAVGVLETWGGYNALFVSAIVTLLLSASTVLGLSRETGGPAMAEPASEDLDTQCHNEMQRS